MSLPPKPVRQRPRDHDFAADRTHDAKLAVEHVLMDLEYRWLDMDDQTGEGNDRFGYDVLTQGPALGFSFRF